jgi:hypothetical protein
MAISMNSALRNRRWDATFNGTAGIAMFDNGVLEIRAGTRPATADASLAGTTVLVSITLPADAMGASIAGVIAKSGTWQAAASGSGTATFFTVRDSGSTYRMDGTVGVGQDMQLDNTNIASGQQVTVSTFQLTDPA